MPSPPDPDGPDMGVDANDLEFVEIYNPTGETVPLAGWELNRSVGFDFQSGVVIAPGQALVILSFNPANPENLSRLEAFRDYYGLPESMPLLGGFSGRLDNAGDRVQLSRPDLPPPDDPLLHPLAVGRSRSHYRVPHPLARC